MEKRFVDKSNLTLRRSIRAIYGTAILAMAGNACISPSILSLVIIKLGGSEFHLSIMQFAWLVPLVFGLLAMPVTEYKGKKPVLIGGYMAGVLLTLPILLVPVFAEKWPGTACIWLIVLSVTLMSTANSLGVAGWFPLLQDNIPRQLRGRFFGGFRTAWQISNLIMIIAVSIYLGKEASWEQYLRVFSLGILFYAARVGCFFYVTETVPVKPRHTVPSAWNMLKDFCIDKTVRPTVKYLVSYAFAITLAETFKIKMLKEFGYSDGAILGAVAMVNIGAILSLRTWGRLADKYGNRFIFGITHITVGICTLGWVFVGPGKNSMILVYFLYFCHSIFNGGNYLAQSRYLLSEVPSDKTSHLSIINNISFVVWGFSPFVGAAILTLFANTKIGLGALTIGNYDILFIITALLFIIPHRLRLKLGLKHETSTRQVLSFLTKPIIYSISPFNRIK